MKHAAFALLLASAVLANSNVQFCKVNVGHGLEIDLSPIYPANYNTTMAGVNGLTPVLVNFGWCWFVNDTSTCNQTNKAMFIKSSLSSNNLPPCVASFGAFLTSIQNTSSGVTFQLWDAEDGYINTITVNCDKQGANNTATLVAGTFLNTPVYRYSMTFTSVHACPQP